MPATSPVSSPRAAVRCRSISAIAAWRCCGDLGLDRTDDLGAAGVGGLVRASSTMRVASARASASVAS